jgi:hypothetical protein
MTGRLLLLALLLAILPRPASAGTVRTLDGKVYDGDVRYDPKGKVVVTPPGGQPLEVEFANILQVVFGPPSATPPPKPGDVQHGLLGTYFDTKDLKGKSVMRVDPVIQFNWGQGFPMPEIQVDAFSVRWEGKVEAPESGDYTFVTRTNDGLKLWVDNRLIIDHWAPPEGLKEWSGSIRLEKGRRVDLKMEYQEQGGNAEAHLLWKGPGIANTEIVTTRFLYPAPPPPPTVTAAGNDAQKALGKGLLAIYYNSRDLSGQAVTRIDPKVDFDWGEGAPVPGVIGPDSFSVRWIGQVRAPATEEFAFHTVTDDGVRLWINNQLIIDQWQDQSASESSGSFPLKAGQLYDIRMEYYEGSGVASAKLSWSSKSIPRQIIPTECLIPVSGGTKVAARPKAPPRLHSLQGLVLRNGSLVKSQVERADDSVVRYHRDRERDLTVSASCVAYIIPQQFPAAMASKVPPGRTGVLLRSGDFFEGDIRYIRDGRVRVSSVLFGLRDFGFWDCVVIVYHDPSFLPAAYEIRSSDGSVYMASAFGFEKEKDIVVVKDVSAGPLKVLVWDIQEITCGTSRYQVLTETRLLRAEFPPGMTLADAVAVDALPGGMPMWMEGQPVDHGLSEASGTALTYDLGGSYRTFYCRVGLADGSPGGARLRFLVLADGTEVFRSPDRAAGEGAVDVAVDVAGAKKLTLRVEPAGMPDARLHAVWKNPVLIRP